MKDYSLHTKPKKRITLDDLALMVHRGFLHMDEKFTKRFDTMDARFDAMDKRFNDAEQRDERRFQEIEDEIRNDHRPRIRALEKVLDM